MKHLLLIATIVCEVLFCYAGQDTSVCAPGGFKSDGVTKPFPPMPDVFHSHIELNVPINKTVRSLYEIFDAPNNRAIIIETESTGLYKNISLAGKEIYNFYSNQIVDIIPLPDGSTYCSASQLDGKGTETFMFGNSVTSSTGFSAASAFMINQAFPPVYKGLKTMSNGVTAETWLDCHYIPALDATVTAEWYFSAADWTTPLGTQIPLMLKIMGKLYANNPKGRIVDHSYTFSGFSDYITDHEAQNFMIPQGVVCPFLKSFDVNSPKAHNIPPIGVGGYFSFEAELVQQTDDQSGLVSNIKEYYDNKLKLSRFDYVPQGLITRSFDHGSNHPITEIHDFTTGLAYIIDVERGNCTIHPLNDASKFDVSNIDATHVRMKTVNEFFGIDSRTAKSSMNWTYTGRRTIRDMQADTYVAEKIGYPPGGPADVRSIWELAFSSPQYLDVASNLDGIEVQEPVRLWIKIPSVGITQTYNIFDFNEEEPDAWTYDVGTCFNDDQITIVNFKLPGDQKALIEKNSKEFTYWILTSILGYLDLTPIRVSDLDWFVDDDDEDIIVQFQILDPPSMIGSTNKNLPTSYMNPTDKAVALLKKAVDGGNFVVEAGSLGDNTITPIVAIKGSVQRGKVETKTVIKVIKDCSCNTSSNTSNTSNASNTSNTSSGSTSASNTSNGGSTSTSTSSTSTSSTSSSTSSPSTSFATSTSTNPNLEQGSNGTKVGKCLEVIPALPVTTSDGGLVAGLGVGLFVVGLGVGVLIIFIINRVRRVSLPNLSMSFEPKIFKNESYG